MGLISRIGRTGDRLEEDGRPLGRGWKLSRKRPASGRLFCKRRQIAVHPQFRCIVLLYLLLSL